MLVLNRKSYMMTRRTVSLVASAIAASLFAFSAEAQLQQLRAARRVGEPQGELLVRDVREAIPRAPGRKRDGRLIFIEHGRSADPGVRIWQDRLTPMWKHIGGGCHLNRKIDDLIQAAGFQITDQRNFYLPGPRPMTYTYQGMASVV